MISSGEVLGEKEVGAAAHDHHRLGQGIKVQGLKLFLRLNLNVQGTFHLHSEGVGNGIIGDRFH